MRRALEYVKKFNGVIAQHAQDPRLTVGAQMNEGEVSSQLGLKGWPTIAEEAIIARDILLADHVGSRLHICHLTSAGGVELVRWAKARGIAVTAEVTPHHLLLTDELARSYDPIYKVNPPLRRASDVQALRDGLADDTIDIIATDHAPHPSESKECEWQEASFGMLGLESALAIANMVLVETGLLTWRGIAEKLSINPAAIAGYGDHGSDLSVGKTANITIIDPKREWRVDRDLVQSRSKNTPYHGMQMRGVARDVIYRGSVVLRNGEVHNG
jgi:dihydroorotase